MQVSNRLLLSFDNFVYQFV